jgi:ferredoxin
MTFIVTGECIKCKYLDCIEVCPVDCFYVGENMVVIHEKECIDCGVCKPECPVGAIIPEKHKDTSEEKRKYWLDINIKYSRVWPNLTSNLGPLPDAEKWDHKKEYNGDPEKREHFSPEPGKSDDD